MQRLLDLLMPAADEEEPLLKTRVLGLRAWLQLCRAEFDVARELLAEAEAHCQWAGHPAAGALLLQYCRTTYSSLTGDAQAMKQILGEIAGSGGPGISPIFLSLKGAQAIAAEDWNVARAALVALEADSSTIQWPPGLYAAQAMRAALEVHEGQPQRALSILRETGPRSADWDLWGSHARVRATWARAELRCGNIDQAWQALEPALRAARESGEILGLLTCGPTALNELAATSWPAHVDPADTALLRSCAAQALALRATKSDDFARGPQAEQLSHREVEVLHLVAEGQSNKHIARALDLSPHTVKRHVARILAKTGKSTRGQAAAWLNAHAG